MEVVEKQHPKVVAQVRVEPALLSHERVDAARLLKRLLLVAPARVVEPEHLVHEQVVF